MSNTAEEIYMQRCLDIAKIGLGNVAPNPMVGCVIVKDGIIIGEGFHQKYGDPHAEVNAINSVEDKDNLPKSTLYVSLEPCVHHGKTPPCIELILKYNIPKVIVACLDVNTLVSGKGVEILRKNGVEVICGLMQKEAEELNTRFFTFHKKKRPYIILKWAQTLDGKIWSENESKVSNEISHLLNHKWRTEESTILIGKNTALTDNPELSARHYHGKNPIRLLIDKNLDVPLTNQIFNSNARTIVFTSQKKSKHLNIEYISCENITPKLILDTLYCLNILSVIIEGGAKTLQSFIDENLWDESRIIIGNKYFGNGIDAPVLLAMPKSIEELSGDKFLFFKNESF